jgi:hypothetical protein
MFSRVTVGFPMSPQVTQFELTRGLSWRTVVDGHPDSKAYHGWVITATATGCRVLTEETQQGPFFLEELGRKNPGALYRYHQVWENVLLALRRTPAKHPHAKQCSVRGTTTTQIGVRTGFHRAARATNMPAAAATRTTSMSAA